MSAAYSQKRRRSGHGDYSKLRVYRNTSTTGMCTHSFTIRTRRDDNVYELHNTFGTMRLKLVRAGGHRYAYYER